MSAKRQRCPNCGHEGVMLAPESAHAVRRVYARNYMRERRAKARGERARPLAADRVLTEMARVFVEGLHR